MKPLAVSFALAALWLACVSSSPGRALADAAPTASGTASLCDASLAGVLATNKIGPFSDPIGLIGGHTACWDYNLALDTSGRYLTLGTSQLAALASPLTSAAVHYGAYMGSGALALGGSLLYGTAVSPLGPYFASQYFSHGAGAHLQVDLAPVTSWLGDFWGNSQDVVVRTSGTQVELRTLPPGGAVVDLPLATLPISTDDWVDISGYGAAILGVQIVTPTVGAPQIGSPCPSNDLVSDCYVQLNTQTGFNGINPVRLQSQLWGCGATFCGEWSGLGNYTTVGGIQAGVPLSLLQTIGTCPSGTYYYSFAYRPPVAGYGIALIVGNVSHVTYSAGANDVEYASGVLTGGPTTGAVLANWAEVTVPYNTPNSVDYGNVTDLFVGCTPSLSGGGGPAPTGVLPTPQLAATVTCYSSGYVCSGALPTTGPTATTLPGTPTPTPIIVPTPGGPTPVPPQGGLPSCANQIYPINQSTDLSSGNLSSGGGLFSGVAAGLQGLGGKLVSTGNQLFVPRYMSCSLGSVENAINSKVVVPSIDLSALQSASDACGWVGFRALSLYPGSSSVDVGVDTCTSPWSAIAPITRAVGLVVLALTTLLALLSLWTTLVGTGKSNDS